MKSVILDVGKETYSVLQAVYAYSGCDITSAFLRKGKPAPVNMLKQHPEFLHTFAQLGTSLQLPSPVFDELKQPTCLLYGGSVTRDINKLRFEKFLERFRTKQGELLTSCSGVDVSFLPPCRSSLSKHIKGVSYQTFIWSQADRATQILSPPDAHGWE